MYEMCLPSLFQESCKKSLRVFRTTLLVLDWIGGSPRVEAIWLIFCVILFRWTVGMSTTLTLWCTINVWAFVFNVWKARPFWRGPKPRQNNQLPTCETKFTFFATGDIGGVTYISSTERTAMPFTSWCPPNMELFCVSLIAWNNSYTGCSFWWKSVQCCRILTVLTPSVLEYYWETFFGDLPDSDAVENIAFIDLLGWCSCFFFAFLNGEVVNTNAVTCSWGEAAAG